MNTENMKRGISIRSDGTLYGTVVEWDDGLEETE